MQYVPILADDEIEVSVSPLLDDHYLRARYLGSTALEQVFMGYWRRMLVLAKAKQYDLIWIEKEVLPWLPTLVELSVLPKAVPVVVDYDDAQFHRYDLHPSKFVRSLLSTKIDRVMEAATLVTVGNEYLANRARSAGANQIEFFPTVVDLSRYPQRSLQSGNKRLVIGWIGTAITAKYLLPVMPALVSAAKQFDARISIVGANALALPGFDLSRVDFHDWSEQTEAALIEKMDIGIMPLPDSPFERGKCGYKLIQYMACSKPVIASPVGENSKIVVDGLNGILANDNMGWLAALSELCAPQSAARRIQMGAEGRLMIEREYSLQVHGPRLCRIFKQLARDTNKCAA